MEQNTGPQRRQEAQGRKNPVVRLRIPTLIMALFLACVAIATAYMAGVMSGRQAKPSSANRSEAAYSISTKTSAQVDKESGRPQESGKGEQILSAEELEFARVLRRDENAPLSRLKNAVEKKIDPEKKDSHPGDSPSVTETPPRQSLQKSLEEEKGDEIADYIFQVGAFKDEKTVDSLREKLEGHGLRTMMRREGKLYLVLVRLRGTARRAAELVGLFNELGVGEPVLRSRSPARP